MTAAADPNDPDHAMLMSDGDLEELEACDQWVKLQVRDERMMQANMEHMVAELCDEDDENEDDEA